MAMMIMRLGGSHDRNQVILVPISTTPITWNTPYVCSIFTYSLSSCILSASAFSLNMRDEPMTIMQLMARYQKSSLWAASLKVKSVPLLDSYFSISLGSPTRRLIRSGSSRHRSRRGTKRLSKTSTERAIAVVSPERLSAKYPLVSTIV